jgi:hypothetical protein
MKHYIFFAEGLGKEFSAVARSEKAARSHIWHRLANDEQNQIEFFECVEKIPYGKYSVILEVSTQDDLVVAEIALMAKVPHETADAYAAKCAESLRYQLELDITWKILGHISAIYPFPVTGSIKVIPIKQ